MSVKNLSMNRPGYCHSVDLSHNGQPVGEASKEEMFFQLTATWRGTPVVVEMTANRYRHSSGWSDWRVYAPRAVEASVDPDGLYTSRGADVTDTARQRLAEAARPLVTAWLASDAYAPSRQAAFAKALESEVRRLADYSVDRVRGDLARFAHELTPEAADRLRRAVDAYATFAAVLRGDA